SCSNDSRLISAPWRCAKERRHMPAEKELVDLERSYWKALRDKDAGAAVRLTADPCIVTGAQGVASFPRQAMKGMIEGATWTLKSFDLSDFQIQRIGNDVAVIAYKVKEELIVDGKPLTLNANDASTWVRRDGAWQCALHTESIAGDPYGRDRK